jgi:hypothetical protein
MISNGRDIIRAGYAKARPVADIARDCESTPGSVKVTAHRMGIRHGSRLSERVPADQRDDYQYFTRNKALPVAYVVRVLGLETVTI